MANSVSNGSEKLEVVKQFSVLNYKKPGHSDKRHRAAFKTLWAITFCLLMVQIADSCCVVKITNDIFYKT